MASADAAPPTTVVTETLKWLSIRVKKTLVVFFDEVDCLADATLISFLRQLRNGRISCKLPGTFPTSVALIGMRDIRDYRAKIRPDSETMGSASPFNVITKAMTLRVFTAEEGAWQVKVDIDYTAVAGQRVRYSVRKSGTCGTRPFDVGSVTATEETGANNDKLVVAATLTDPVGVTGVDVILHSKGGDQPVGGVKQDATDGGWDGDRIGGAFAIIRGR